MKKKILIFGKNGQIASNLIKLFTTENDFVIYSFSSKEVDFADLKGLSLFLNNLNNIPDFIINAAAYTNVEKAEEEKELADLINHKAVKIIADYCFKNDIKLIHYSTDYVFDGTGNKPYTEDNIINLKPVNYYGLTKLGGENAIINSNCQYIILRTAWIYDKNGKNFVNTVSRLAREKEFLNVVDDQIGSPTPAKFVALNTIQIIKKLVNWKEKFPSGIYHLTSGRYISWYQFALEIIADLKIKNPNVKLAKIRPIPTSEYKTLAKRGLNSRLDCHKIVKTFELNLNENKI